MKFTTKSVHIVASVAHLKYLYIYIKYLYAKFTCLRYAHILFSVLKNVRGLGFRVNSIVGFCFM